MTFTIHPGDALAVLRTLPGASVHCCITSPPYLGLRDYRVAGMIGLEPTWAEHLAALLAILDVEMRRVLRPDGLLIVNYGDKYCSKSKWGGASGNKNEHTGDGGASRERAGDYGLGLPDKCRMALPERLLIAMMDRGWIYRAKSPWIKRNGLPDSAGDRLGANLEDIYIFAHPECARRARGRYYWDAEAVRLEYALATVARAEVAARNGGEEIDHQAPGQAKTGVQRVISHPGRSRRMGDAWVESLRAIVGCAHTDQATGSWNGSRFDAGKTASPERGGDRAQKQEGRKRKGAGRRDGNFDQVYDASHPERQERSHEASAALGGLVLNEAGEPLGLYESTQGFNGAKLLADLVGDVGDNTGKPLMRDPACSHHGKNGQRTFRGECTCTPVTEDHYATFPEALVEPFIKAATSERGCCPACGAPWERVVEDTGEPDPSHNGSRFDQGKTVAADGHGNTQAGERTLKQTTGWRPGCECTVGWDMVDGPSVGPKPLDPIPCTVLDPFSGAGTTLLVADRLGRHGVGIELNPKYIAMAHKRLAKDAPLFHGEARG